jgi:hypothetical protein
MSLSGTSTGALLPYTAQDMLEEATSRAGIPPEGITGEHIFQFLRQLNLVFTSLVNQGVQLWKRQYAILPCYLGINQIPTPPGTNDVVTLNRRSLFRQLGTSSFSDSGGVPGNAFDDNFATACVQTSANGSIGQGFITSTIVTNVGVLSGTTGEFALFFEYSNDGVTYTPVDAIDVQWNEVGQWTWFDLLGSPVAGALFWRVRSVGSVPFGATEIFFGNTPQEINLGRWNLENFSQMPNKAQGGQVVNWYVNRDLSGPTLYVWPTPDTTAKYDTLTCWVNQNLDPVGSITQALDLPARWYDAITARMARRICRTFKEADLKRYQTLQQEEMEAIALAVAEERDNSPTEYDLGLQNYTA